MESQRMPQAVPLPLHPAIRCVSSPGLRSSCCRSRWAGLSTPLTAQAQSLGGSPSRRSRCAGRRALCRSDGTVFCVDPGTTNQRCRHRQIPLPRDHDLLERSLTEYLFCAASLDQFGEGSRCATQELHQVALRCKTQHDLQFAALTDQDPVLWRTLNQSFYRSDIRAEVATESCTS